MTKATNIKISKPNSLLQRNQEKAELSVRDRAGWRRVKFGNVVECLNDVERNPLAAGIERVVGLDHLDPGSLHIKRWASIEEGTSFSRRFRPGQVLFGKRGTDCFHRVRTS